MDRLLRTYRFLHPLVVPTVDVRGTCDDDPTTTSFPSPTSVWFSQSMVEVLRKLSTLRRAAGRFFVRWTRLWTQNYLRLRFLSFPVNSVDKLVLIASINNGKVVLPIMQSSSSHAQTNNKQSPFRANSVYTNESPRLVVVKIKNKCARVTRPTKQKTRTREKYYQRTKGANNVVVAGTHTSYRIIASNNALPDKSIGLIHSYSRRITHERVMGAFFFVLVV